MLSGTSSTKSSRVDRANSYFGSQDASSSISYLDDNLLEEATTVAPPLNFSRPKASTIKDLASLLAREQAVDPRLVIAIDFGTTFTGVGYVLTVSNIAELSSIELVMDWGKLMNSQHKIPSVISYSPANNGERQWGADISKGAVIMKNMKLELEVQHKRIDELELTLQLLEGTDHLNFESIKRFGGNPDYSPKAPTEIVKDYLSKVCKHAWEAIEPVYLYGTKRPPVDIVVTVPAGWSYRATNATCKALRLAGFNQDTIPTLNDMILLTEPEAASQFTVRHLREQGSKFLKLNEPFILCDAGGGTVDVVAYQVKLLEPHLELAQVSEPDSAKCGAAYIDTYFKRWLRRIIGQDRYREIDSSYAGQRIGTHITEGEEMRRLIKDFDDKKKIFSNKSEPFKLDLPDKLEGLTTGEVVKEGEIIIQPADMREIVNPCVSKLIALIEKQRLEVEEKNNRRVKNVLLVGGFGESPYLQEELGKSLALRGIKLRRPEKLSSWTAVVRGAVIYGVERHRQKQLKIMSESPRSYGIVIDEPASYAHHKSDCYMDPLTNSYLAQGQFAWLVRKGDLLLSDGPIVAEKGFTRTFVVSDSRKFELPIYVYPDEDDDVPNRWANGQHDVAKAGSIRCDISKVSHDVLQSRRNYDTLEEYLLAHLVCKVRATLTTLDFEVYVKDTMIGHNTLTIGEDELRRRSMDSSESWEH